MNGKVLVVGASGAQGGSVARRLLEEGFEVVAAARNTEKLKSLVDRGAEAVSLDLTNSDQVAEAAKDVRFAFFHMPMSLSGPEGGKQEAEALHALLEGGIEHISYNTGFAIPPEPVGSPELDGRINLVKEMLETEKATVLVPTGYLENFSAPWSVKKLEEGELVYPLSPEVRVAWVTNLDVGTCTAKALATEAARGQRLRVAGPENLTLPEVAERIGRALGKTIRFRQLSGAEYAEILAPYLGEGVARGIGASYDRMANDQNPLMTPDTSQTRQLLRVEFTDVESWARKVLV
jgi:uncharacterized protein YbjT (DUF2867 family)